MAAGEAEAPSAVGAFVSPGHVLDFTAFESGAHVGIAGVVAIASPHRFLRGMGREDGSDALHPGDETHVEIPLVADLEGLHATGDGVGGEGLEIGIPMGVDRPVPFEVAAHPLEELAAGLSLGGLHRVVQAGQATAVLQFHVEPIEVLVGHVPAAAVAVEDDGIGVLEDLGIARPVLGEVDGGLDLVAHVLVELPGEEEASGPVFVLAIAVAAVARHEDDLLFLGSFRLRLVTEQSRSGEGKKEGGGEDGEGGFQFGYWL